MGCCCSNGKGAWSLVLGQNIGEGGVRVLMVDDGVTRRRFSEVKERNERGWLAWDRG